MIPVFATTALLETVPPGTTPVWVVLMIAFLVLALFVWGVINSSGSLGSPNSSTVSDDSHHDAHDTNNDEHH